MTWILSGRGLTTRLLLMTLETKYLRTLQGVLLVSSIPWASLVHIENSAGPGSLIATTVCVPITISAGRLMPGVSLD